MDLIWTGTDKHSTLHPDRDSNLRSQKWTWNSALVTLELTGRNAVSADALPTVGSKFP